MDNMYLFLKMYMHIFFVKEVKYAEFDLKVF